MPLQWTRVNKLKYQKQRRRVLLLFITHTCVLTENQREIYMHLITL